MYICAGELLVNHLLSETGTASWANGHKAEICQQMHSRQIQHFLLSIDKHKQKIAYSR